MHDLVGGYPHHEAKSRHIDQLGYRNARPRDFARMVEGSGDDPLEGCDESSPCDAFTSCVALRSTQLHCDLGGLQSLAAGRVGFPEALDTFEFRAGQSQAKLRLAKLGLLESGVELSEHLAGGDRLPLVVNRVLTPLNPLCQRT